jgi:hypothetical protein
MTPNEDWDKFSGGWAFEEFKAECVKRHMQAYTPDDPNFPVLRKR